MIDAAGTVLAHQGGWDEMLFVLAPLVVFAGLLVMARRRVDEMEARDEASPAGDAGAPSDPDVHDPT